MNHLEIEFKTMLTKEEHDRLLQLFADITAVSQTNYYIESDRQSIRHAHMAFRVRTFNHREAKLTLKIPQEVGSLELNQRMLFLFSILFTNPTQLNFQFAHRLNIRIQKLFPL